MLSCYIYVLPPKKHIHSHRDNSSDVCITYQAPKRGIKGWGRGGLAEQDQLYLKSDVNQTATGTLRKSTTVSSQCEWYSYP